MSALPSTQIKGTVDLGHLPGAACDPHVVALIAKIPEHKIHVDLARRRRGFGNKVGAYPGYI